MNETFNIFKIRILKVSVIKPYFKMKETKNEWKNFIFQNFKSVFKKIPK